MAPNVGHRNDFMNFCLTVEVNKDFPFVFYICHLFCIMAPNVKISTRSSILSSLGLGKISHFRSLPIAIINCDQYFYKNA